MLAASRWIKCLLLLMCTPWIAHAQITQTGRLEITINNELADKYAAVGLGENGIILYRRILDKKDDRLEMIKLDTALHESWNGAVNIDKTLTLLRVQPYKDQLFLLLKDRFFLGGDFRMIQVFVGSGQFIVHTIKNLIPFNPSEFALTDESAVIGGYFNYRPVILHYNLQLQLSKVLAGFFNSPGEINQLKPNADGSVDVVVSAKNLEKRKSLWIRNYNSTGDLVKTTILQPEEDKNLLFGRSVKLNDGQQIVAGVYGRFTDYSRGIFVASINEIGEYSIVYYNFAQLENFFSYMKAGQQKRVKQRIERRTIKGKKIKFNYRFLIQDIIPYQNQYIMTGEAFYPNYTYPSTRMSNTRSIGFGTSVPGSYSPSSFYRSEMIFDGYQYTHAVVIGFDQSGKIKWDNSFEINDVKTMQLERFVKVMPDTNRIVMMYLFRNALRAKIIRDGQVLEGKTKDDIQIANTYEKVDLPNIESEHLDFWYGRYFFAYGIQKLDRGSSDSRKIFFLSKITYK